MTLVYNIMFLYRFFFIFNKSLSILQGLVHILQFFIYFFFYTAFSFPLPLSSCLLSCFMICTFKKHLSMNSTQHHTIYFIIVSEFNQISFALMHYPSPSLLFLFLISCGYILFYYDADASVI